jgi:polyribonucleotide nucleotidyltransferase
MAVFTFKKYGLEVEIGKFAGQADGSAWIKQGGTVVLSTICSAPTQDFPGFLPLSVDYREQFSAAGKIPGGYFKREGKFTDREVLTSRLIDRAIRPLFPAHYFDQLQVMNIVYSVDREHTPEILSLLASSLALTISPVPFMGPVGAVEIARVDGQWIYNPLYEQITKSDVKIIVAGTEEGVCMLEGCMDQVIESELLDVIFKAHEIIKEQIEWQRSVAAELNVVKKELVNNIDWQFWEDKSFNFWTDERLAQIYKLHKVDRAEVIKKLKADFFEQNAELIEQQANFTREIDYALEECFKTALTNWILKSGKRVDGRDFTQVRPISTEVGILPFVHGSCLFKRGNTQALTSLTLGSSQDEQKVELLMGGDVDINFILHYNFHSFSVGEVKSSRGPGRREVGHGYLALSGLKYVIPSKNDFPYTIRLLTDILESDGSTSMATVCSGTMALMDGGVPIKHMVSGVAMGLLKSTKGEFQAITDISGFEDAFGWMDFKVTGTDAGVTAIQLDIKNKGGLPKSVFNQALQQAKDGRIHILNEMRKALTTPRSELSDLVPQIVSLKIPTDKIGAVIGSGGKVIREIIDTTKVESIDIDDDGTVRIFAGPQANLDQAINWVKTLAGQIEKGAIYKGKVRRHVEFGIFIELVPGQDGLLHISAIPKDKQNNLAQNYKADSEILVEVAEYDTHSGKIRLKLVNP